jgi:uncharacterized protein (TIGR02302 family)
MTDRSADHRTPFAMRLWLARAALLWERAWPGCWPALAILGVFLILTLFRIPPLLPGLAHGAVLLAFGAAFLVALARGLHGIAPPDGVAARRRIERASGIEHRPLQALADQPSAPLDPLSEGLWQAHRQRMAAAARRLRVGLPAASLATRDPWGLRAVLAILLLLAFVDAGGDWRERLMRGLTPSLDTGGAPVIAASLDIWVTPPEYTGLPPQFLRPENRQTIRIPVGSTLLAQVHGGGAAPELVIDGKSSDFDKIDSQDFRAQAKLKSGRRIEVSQAGAALGSWPIEIIPDNPPTVAFAKPPEPTVRQALRFDYRATDDYGVESVKAVIRRQGAKAGGKSGDKIELELPLPGLHLKEAQATSYHDLTAHPWAGLPVEIRLVAADALGQTGESAPAHLNLPERVFRNPIARAIIDQRKELVKDPNSRLAVAEILGDLQSRPQLYGDDTIVFLALRVAQERLRLHKDAAAIAEVEQLLWDTALRIEDGGASLAENELRRLQRQLQDALAKNAPDQEIDRLMSELRQALDRYLQALAQNMARNPDQNQQPVDPSQRVMTSRDLERMLDKARELAKNGQRDQARQLLSELQNMLENLRTARPGQGSQQGSLQAQQMMRGMRELMQRQQQLLDRSFRAEQQGEQGQTGMPGSQGDARQQGDAQQPGGVPQQGRGQQGANADMGDAAGQQEALRHALGEMMRRMGDGLGNIPDPLGRAERAMNDAARALRQSRPGDAIGPQTDALDQLQQAAREFAQQMQQRLGNTLGQGDDRDQGNGFGQPRDRVERDPLGRPLANGGAYDQGDVKIPDNNTMQKARDILDELRRRAGERDRPQIELDYIDRLLQRF